MHGRARNRRGARATAFAVTLAVALTCAPSALAGTGGVGPGPGDDAVVVEGAQPFEGRNVVAAGQAVNVKATIANGPAGGTLELAFLRGTRTLAVERLPLAGGPQEHAVAFTPATPGEVLVRARIAQASGQPARSAEVSTRFTALRPAADLRDRGLHVRYIQRKLLDQRHALRLTGRFDTATARAVIAYRKINGLPRTTNVTRDIFGALSRGEGGFRPRFPGDGRHAEGDLSRQVLALVNADGTVQRVYHTSTGRPEFRTPTGDFRFYRKVLGDNGVGMIDSVYFTRRRGERDRPGYRPACAIHGYFVVPTTPRSHCCFRVPLAESRSIYRWLRVGDRFRVYGNPAGTG